MTVKVFVEGGGDSNDLRTACRRGFGTFLAKLVPHQRHARVVASGSRNAAFDDFCTAIKNGEVALLLVDAERPVTSSPWEHLGTDRMPRPANAADDAANLMVVCMEAWFLADHETLATFYGKGFAAAALPARKDVEGVAKNDVMNALKKASAHTKKGPYDKGSHAFAILECIDAHAVRKVAPHVEALAVSLRLLLDG